MDQANGLREKRRMDYGQEERNVHERKLWAMVLRTKPHNNSWLYLSPRLCTMGRICVRSRTIGDKGDVKVKVGVTTLLQLMKEINTISLDRFQADILLIVAEYEGSDAIFAWMVMDGHPRLLAVAIPGLQDT